MCLRSLKNIFANGHVVAGCISVVCNNHLVQFFLFITFSFVVFFAFSLLLKKLIFTTYSDVCYLLFIVAQ